MVFDLAVKQITYMYIRTYKKKCIRTLIGANYFDDKAVN